MLILKTRICWAPHKTSLLWSILLQKKNFLKKWHSPRIRVDIIEASSHFTSGRVAEAYFHILLPVRYLFLCCPAVSQNVPLFAAVLFWNFTRSSILSWILLVSEDRCWSGFWAVSDQFTNQQTAVWFLCATDLCFGSKHSGVGSAESGRRAELWEDCTPTPQWLSKYMKIYEYILLLYMKGGDSRSAIHFRRWDIDPRSFPVRWISNQLPSYVKW